MNSPEYTEQCQFLLDQIRNSPHLKLKRAEALAAATPDRPYYPCRYGCALEVNHDGACMTHQQNYERIRR